MSNSKVDIVNGPALMPQFRYLFIVGIIAGIFFFYKSAIVPGIIISIIFLPLYILKKGVMILKDQKCFKNYIGIGPFKYGHNTSYSSLKGIKIRGVKVNQNIELHGMHMKTLSSNEFQAKLFYDNNSIELKRDYSKQKIEMEMKSIADFLQIPCLLK